MTTTAITRLAALIWATGLSTLPVSAQQPVDASRITPRDLRPDPATAAPSLDLSMPTTGSRPQADPTLTVTVAHVQVIDGFADMADATAALTDPFHGRRSSSSELIALADALETAYNSAGYVFARVTIPPQEVVDDGEFTLRVIDGYLDAINLDAVPARQRAVLNATLQPLVDKPQLKITEIERALMLAGQTPGLAIRSTLVPGEETGATTLVLEADHTLFSGNWSSNNRLSQSLGGWQSNLQLQLNQPLGFGEQFYAYFTGHPSPKKLLYMDDRRRVGGAGVNWPIGHNGLSLNLEITASDTFVDTGNPLIPATQSRFRRQSIRLSTPLRLTRASQLSVTGIVEMSSQFNAVPAFNLQLFRDELRVVRVNMNMNRPVISGASLNLFVQYSQGLDSGVRSLDDVVASGVPFSRPGSRPDFAKLEVTADLTTFLPRDFVMLSTLRAQHAFDKALPSSELFSIDGENALSAMVSGRLADDAGWTARNELSKRYTFWNNRIAVSPFAYASFGMPETNIAGEEATADYATSAGIGLRASGGPFSASVEYGHSRTSPVNTSGDEFFANVQVVF